MCNKYALYKEKLIELKETIDKQIKIRGVSIEILNYEYDFKKNYNNALKHARTPADREFISFNYFAPRTYILLAKDYKFQAITSFCEAIFHYIRYLDCYHNPDFNKWDLKYYNSLANHIKNSKPNLFGNTSRDNLQKIFDSLKKVVSVDSKHLNLEREVNKLLSDFLYSLVANSTEIYTNEHLKTSEEIKNISLSFTSGDNLIKATLKSLAFILAKRKLHYYLRQLVPKETGVIKDRNSIDKNIKTVIENMRTIADEEINLFKNIKKSDIDERTEFKRFFAKIDKLSTEYYKSLWIEKNIINSLKELENIFSEIRNNWQKIKTSSMFNHFVQEFVFLSNYLKLLLIARDFKKFGENLSEKEWQREIAEKCSATLYEIANHFFKYGMPTSLERKLLIVEEPSSGKFVEFIVFYLLKEFVLNKINFRDIQDKDIQSLLSILSELKDPSSIEWNYRGPNEKTDIDILISIPNLGEYAIFLKTGILSSNDERKIDDEITCSKNLKIKKIYQIIDISKNLNIAKKLLKKYPEVVILDVGKFLRILLDIAHNNKKISLELSRSSILNWAGFYSGG